MQSKGPPLREHASPLDVEQKGDDVHERRRLMRFAVDIAEKLDELERRLDPNGSPPRHAAMAYHRLRTMTQDD